jgi:TIR domain
MPRVVLLPHVKIFISLVHTRPLLGLVTALRTRLEPWGVDFILALEDPRPGFDVDQKSRELIDAADAALFLCSQEAPRSRRVIAEYAHATSKGKPICLLRFIQIADHPFPAPSGFDTSREWVLLRGAYLQWGGWRIDEPEFERTVELAYQFASRLRTE